MTANTYEVWEIKSNARLQKFFTAAGLLLGLLLAVLGFNVGGFTNRGSASALLLGLLIVLAAIANLLINNRRRVRVEPKRRRILITDKTRFKQQQQTILFGEIKEVYVTEQADKEGGSVSYDVELKLRNGRTISLFRAAFFEETYHKSAMENHCQRFRQILDL